MLLLMMDEPRDTTPFRLNQLMLLIHVYHVEPVPQCSMVLNLKDICDFVRVFEEESKYNLVKSIVGMLEGFDPFVPGGIASSSYAEGLWDISGPIHLSVRPPQLYTKDCVMGNIEHCPLPVYRC
ncbi:photosystem II apoprotein, chloroplast [Artemisia annua]|uniref:Photosystem II apoprotein, chloroplast n=1 Tax=Artemisia annua TaxID=35608 RepID=A0A2U1KJ72_ARTAN|nr:photosystem II apoprotein, chloroplast [Artemisia annua]